MITASKDRLKIEYVPVGELKAADYNPRKHSPEQTAQLKESLTRFGFVDPVICNSTPERKNIVIGGHFRLEVAKSLGHKTAPVVYVEVPDLAREKELNLRLNKNVGDFDFGLLAGFDETLLQDVGFSSEELDDIFPDEPTEEEFDLEKELARAGVSEVTLKTGDVVRLGESRMIIGDSTTEADVMKLFGTERADMVFTDPPYRLAYLKESKAKKAGFGQKRDRRYLGTDSLPEDFTARWMSNAAKVQAKDCHVVVYENWKNLREVWGEMEKYWKVKNMIVWHATNRSQGASPKYSLYSKHDVAMVGGTPNAPLNGEPEIEILQNEYEAALHAVSGKPHWEGNGAGKRHCPTDFVEHNVNDFKSSGQGVVFGAKPVEILIPYIKIMTERGGIVYEPFGGSGSTLIAAEKLDRRCFLVEKQPAYAEVIRRRWERVTGGKSEVVAA